MNRSPSRPNRAWVRIHFLHAVLFVLFVISAAARGAGFEVTRFGSIANGGQDSLASSVSATPYFFSYRITNAGSASLGTVTATGAANCAATILQQPAATLEPGGTALVVLAVEPASAGPWSVQINLPNSVAPFAWTISGTAAATAGDVTATFQQGANGYTGCADTFIRSGFPSTNYASDAEIKSQTNTESYYGLIRWDISSIPTSATVLDAGMTFTTVTSFTAASRVDIYAVARNWVPAQTTWLDYATGTGWEEAGARNSNDKGTDKLAQLGGVTALDAATAYTTPFYDVGKTVVQSWIENSASNYGLILEASTTTLRRLHSANATTEGNRPQLTVLYTTDPQPEIGVTRGGYNVGAGETDSIAGTEPNVVTEVTYLIANSGIAPLSLTSADLVSVASATNCSVAMVEYPMTPVSANGSTQLAIEITPTANGIWSFTVSLPNSDMTDSETNYSWTVNGIAYSPGANLSRSGTGIADGGTDAVMNTQPSVNKDLFYLIANIGNEALTLGTATVSNAVNCSPSVTAQPAASLSANEETTLDVAVTPSAGGAWSFTVSLPTNDPTKNPYNWTVSGNASSTLTAFFQIGGDTAVQDGTINSASPTVNDGNSATIQFSSARSAVIKWDLSSLPASATVQSANVTLWQQDNVAGVVFNAYPLLRNWIESEVTWNNATALQPWQTAGATGASDRGATPAASASATTSGVLNDPHTLSLNATGTSAVQGWINNPAANHGFIFVRSATSGVPDFHSAEAANTAYRPRLTVSYTVSGTPSPEVTITANGGIIPVGGTPSTANETDFGPVEFFAEDASREVTFEIENSGNGALVLTGSPLVAISGIHAADFTVTEQPASNIGAFQVSRFRITFDPSAGGLRTATVTIANNDTDEGTYTFNIQGTGTERALRLLYAGNSFMAPGTGFQQMGGIADIAAADGHPRPVYDDHNGGGADAIDQRYGRTTDGSYMDPIGWQEGVMNKGVLYESPKIAGGLTWDALVINTNSAAFSNVLPRWDTRQYDGNQDVPDLPNEETCLLHWGYVFDLMKAHSPNARLVSYESWVRGVNNNDAWYPAYWPAPANAQAAATFTYLRAAVDANLAHGPGTGLHVRTGSAFRAKNWQEGADGLYRWFSESNIDKHASSRGEILVAMLTYGTLYHDDVSDIRAKNPAAVEAVLAAVEAAPEGSETPLTTADWDALADLADRINGQGAYPKVLTDSTAGHIAITENGTAALRVKLSKQPASAVTVTATHTAGDSDLAISGGAVLTFTTENWNEWQTVTLSAAPDGDSLAGEALISLTTAPAGVLPICGGEDVVAIEDAPTVVSPPGYPEWLTTNNLTGPDALVTADLDGDGMPNLLEYALNADPISADTSKLPVLTESSGNLILTYRKNRSATNLTYTVQSSPDLTTWTDEGTGSKVADPDPDTESWQFTKTISGGKLFLRLKVNE